MHTKTKPNNHKTQTIIKTYITKSRNKTKTEMKTNPQQEHKRKQMKKNIQTLKQKQFKYKLKN